MCTKYILKTRQYFVNLGVKYVAGIKRMLLLDCLQNSDLLLLRLCKMRWTFSHDVLRIDKLVRLIVIHGELRNGTVKDS